MAGFLHARSEFRDAPRMVEPERVNRLVVVA
jgi:hypothetical protein